MNAYATLCNELKRTDLGIPILEEILAIRKATLASDDPKTCLATNNLATGYWKEKRYDKSIPLFEALLAIHKKNTGESSQETAKPSPTWVSIIGMPAGSGSDSLAQAKRGSFRTVSLAFSLIWDLLAAYQRGAMTKELEELVKQIQTKIDSSTQPNSANGVGRLPNWDRISSRKRPGPCPNRSSGKPRDPTKGSTRYLVDFQHHVDAGWGAHGAKKTAEAEPLLTKGWEGLKAREKTVTGTARIRLTRPWNASSNGTRS